MYKIIATNILKNITRNNRQEIRTLPLVLHNDRREWWRKKIEQNLTPMNLILTFLGVEFMGLTVYTLYKSGKPETDPYGTTIPDDLQNLPTFMQYCIRSYRKCQKYCQMIQEPSRDKLLPPIQPHQPKYTLVLELKDVLVHPDWTYNTGWRFKKRPGLEQFLETLDGLYEIVVYTSEHGGVVFPLMQAIDPNKHVAYKLVRDATHYHKGRHVKNLDRLNRDLDKVIVVDWDGGNVQFHKDNLLRIKRWTGADDDDTLVGLTKFLKTIAEHDVDNVKDVLEYYNEYDDVIEAFCEKSVLSEQNRPYQGYSWWNSTKKFLSRYLYVNEQQ